MNYSEGRFNRFLKSRPDVDSCPGSELIEVHVAPDVVLGARGVLDGRVIALTNAREPGVTAHTFLKPYSGPKSLLSCCQGPRLAVLKLMGAVVRYSIGHRGDDLCHLTILVSQGTAVRHALGVVPVYLGVVRVASNTPGGVVPVRGPDHVLGLGGDVDHAVLAHGRRVRGLCVAPGVGGVRIVTHLEAIRQIAEHVFPDRLEALLPQLLPRSIHQVEVKHDHAITVVRLIQVEVSVIEPHMVKNLLDKVSFPFAWSGALCILCKLKPFRSHIVSSSKCPEDSSLVEGVWC